MDFGHNAATEPLAENPEGGDVEPTLTPALDATAERLGLYGSFGDREKAAIAEVAEAENLRRLSEATVSDSALLAAILAEIRSGNDVHRTITRGFDVAGGAQGELVPGYPGRQIYVVGFMLSAAAISNLQIGQGLAVNGVVQGFAPLPGAQAGGKIFAAANQFSTFKAVWPDFLFHTDPGQSVCVANGAGEISGFIQYVLGEIGDAKY